MTGRHAVVVLAAGGSTRLGQAKALLTREGEPLVHRAVRLAGATAPRQVVVVVGAEHARVAAALAGQPCDIVVNEAWRDGLASSLRRAAAVLVDDVAAVLVLACDQPALSAAPLDALLTAAARSPAGCAATRHGDGLGVPAVVPRDWFDDDGLHGDTGFGARLRRQPAGDVALIDAPELAYDVDTPADLDHARARGWLD